MESYTVREQLIAAGIVELEGHGIADFSLRRVAAACNLSCAAPYKHFKDKREFIAAIIDYVNGQWRERQEQILTGCTGGLRQQTVEVVVGYVAFLMEKPWFRSILMLKDAEFDNLYHKARGQMSSRSQQLEEQFFAESGWDSAKIRRKLHIVRAVLFGTVFLIDSGELSFDETVLENVRAAVDREFDLP